MRFFPILTRLIDVIDRVEGASFFNKTNETHYNLLLLLLAINNFKNDGFKQHFTYIFY